MSAPSISYLVDFLAVIDCGSLSGAARKLGRAQAAVTYSVQSLEREFGVTLFDRAARPLKPTEDAMALMPAARQTVLEAARLTAKARSLSQGIEGSVALAVDTLTPTAVLLPLVTAFAEEFPLVELDVIVDALSAPLRSVLEGEAVLGICGPGALRYQDIAAIPIGAVRRAAVAVPSHPLAQMQGPIGTAEAARHRRIVMLNRDRSPTDRGGLTEPANSWRTSDISAKREMIVAGLGWGNMPTHLIDDDIRSGALVLLDLAPEVSARWTASMPLYLIHSTKKPLGVAAQWLFNSAGPPLA